MTVEKLASSDTSTVPQTFQLATRRTRQRLLGLAADLLQRAPESVAASLGYARALEYSGVLISSASEASALSVLAKLNPTLRSPEDSLDAGIAELRVRLRIGDFAGARAIALRMLTFSARVSLPDLERMLPVAVLVDRREAAESLLVRLTTNVDGPADILPPAIAKQYSAYHIGAAVGDCGRLATLRAELTHSLNTHVSGAERPSAIERFVVPGDWMRLTCVGAPVPEGSSDGDPILQAFAALRRGDKSQSRARVHSMAEGRHGAAASAVSWDTRFAEMWILLQSRDTSAAVSRIAAALDNLEGTMDYVLFDVAQSAGLRRSLALCDSLTRVVRHPASMRRCGVAIRALSNQLQSQ